MSGHEPLNDTLSDDAALRRFHDKYDESEDEKAEQLLIKRNARRRRLLRRRILEAKMKALLPQPWKLANPGPIGLFGFGMSSVLFGLHNTGHWPLCTAIPAIAICYGGGAQLIAGLLDFCKGNTFGYVTFACYGAFWLGSVCIWMLPNASFGGPAAVEATSEYLFGVYMILWGIFSFFMLVGGLRMNIATFLTLLSITLLLLVLGGSHMAGNETGVKAAGYIGIVCGGLAMYLGSAEVVNEVWDRVLLPVFPMTDILTWCGAGKKKGEGEKTGEEGEGSSSVHQKENSL